MSIEIEMTAVVNSAFDASKKEPRAIIMDACLMTSNGMIHLLKSSLFKQGEVKALDKISDLYSSFGPRTPDVIVMELFGNGESVFDGLRFIADCSKRWPLTPLVVCTLLADFRFLHQVKNLGATSICHKHDLLSEIEFCIASSIAGVKINSPIIQQLLNYSNINIPVLTCREMDVMDYLFTGRSLTSVALSLHRDIRTISTHKRNAMVKLGYKNNNELYSRGKWMSRNGLFN